MDDEAPTARFPWLTVFWAALILAWLLTVPLFAVQGAFVSFLGTPTGAELALRDNLYGWAQIAAIALPVLGVTVAVAAKQWTAAIVVGSVLLFSAANIAVERSRDRPPTPTTYAPVCQGHRGGDVTDPCPSTERDPSPVSFGSGYRTDRYPASSVGHRWPRPRHADASPPPRRAAPRPRTTRRARRTRSPG
ncbi:hypothetical protein ACQPZF_26030 [Actinosynnema sp. CS-041913]|uniref:hypothetical protein n=1 Tax=Actinosynnema sp. CS-041913 TaxID=3239917 RepID=UPI003D918AB2